MELELAAERLGFQLPPSLLPSWMGPGRCLNPNGSASSAKDSPVQVRENAICPHRTVAKFGHLEKSIQDRQPTIAGMNYFSTKFISQSKQNKDNVKIDHTK